MRRRFYQTIRDSTYLLLLTVFAGGTSSAAEPVVLEGHTNVVSSVVFSRDGTRVISGSWDKTVRVWSVHTGKATQTLTDHEDWVFDVALGADGALVSATQGAVRHWPPPFEKADAYEGLGGSVINAVKISSDGKLLATGGRNGKVNVWRVGASEPHVVLGGFESWVSCLAFSKDRNTLATGTRTGQIKLLSLANDRASVELAGQSGKQVLALAINPAGDVLASGGIDPTVRLWDLSSGKEIAQLSGHKGVVTALAWSADGKKIASGERHGTVRVWDYAAGNQLITTLPGHSDKQLGFTVTSLAFSANGRLLASGSYDKTVKIWNLPE